MKKVIVSIIFIFIVTFSLNVFANEKVEMNLNKNSVESGDEITVSINFSREEQSAYAYTAKLSYDEDVFETINTENFEEQENWSDINYNSTNRKFALINKSGESGKKLVQIKLKVRDNAKQGKTTISIGNVTSTNGEDDISIDGNSVEVQVGNGTQNTTPDEIKNTSNDKISVKTEKNTYKYLAIIPITLSILIIAFLIYINTNNNKINKNKKSIISIISGIVLLAMVILAINILRTEKTDVNNDKITDYDDSDKIVNYLLEIENPDEKTDNQNTDANNAQLDNAQLDVNLDGEISTADIGRVLRSARNDTKSNVAVKSASVLGGTISKRPSGSGNSNTGNTNPGKPSGSGSGTGTTEQPNPGGEEKPTTAPTTIPTITPTNPSTTEPTTNPTIKPTEIPTIEPSIVPTAIPTAEPTVIPTASVDPTATISPEPSESVEKIQDVEGGIYKVKKGNQVELLLDIEIMPATSVKKVKINGEYYEAKYNEESGYYHVKLPTPTFEDGKSYGQKSYTITGIVLDTDKEIPLKDNKITITVEILKEIPTLEEIKYDESGSSITLKFNDPDETIKSGGYVYIYEKTSNGEAKIIARAQVDATKLNLDNGQRTITINLSDFKAPDGSDITIPNGDYNISIAIPYTLDVDGELNGLIGDIEKEIHIVTDYKFTFSDLKIATNPMADGSTVEDITNTSVKLAFTSTNEAVNSEGSPVTVSKVKVKVENQNGESTEQEVTAKLKEGTQDQYEIQVDHKGDTKQTISIESIELSNGKTYNAEKTDVLENQKVTIFLSAPVTQSFTLNLGDDQTNITAGYLLQDLDNTIKSENVKLDLLYKPSQEAQEIKLDEIEVPTNTQENTVASFNKKVTDYRDTISGSYNYKNGNGIYTVKLYATFSRIDGKKHEIQNETGFIGMATATRNVEDIKRAPTVTASIATKTMPYELTVNVTDIDRAFKTGTVTIKKSDGTIVKTEDFTSEQIPFKLQLNKEYLENGNYTIEITYTYQEKEGEALQTGSIPPIDLSNFVSDYGVNFEKIDDVTIQNKIEGVQDGNVILKFTATTKTTNFIETIELDGGETPVGKVTREGNQYTVEIPYESKATRTFQITKLILDNHYAENLDTNRLDTLFTVYLEKPEIETKEDGTQELQLMVDDNTKQSTAKVKIKNNENGSNYRARLTYPNSAEPVEVALTKENENEYTATFGKLADVEGEYKLEILSDYNLVDGNGMLQNQVLGTTTYISKLEAEIVSGSIQREQPAKGEIVTITYKVHDNTGKALKYIEVNGNIYEVKLLEGLATDNETIYTVDVPVPLTHKKIDKQTGAPIVEFVATKLIYEGEEQGIEVKFAFEQKAQNAKPNYENTFENEDEDENRPRMKFRFTDPNEGEKAFRKATVTLKDSKGNVVKTREFDDVDKDYYFLLYNGDEKQEVNGICPQGAQDTFTEAIEGEIYSIEVEIEYDIEYEIKGQENEAPGTIKEVITGLQIKGDYNFKINTNQAETKVDTVTGKTTITFTSTNSMNAEIKSVNIEKVVNGKKETLENIPVKTEEGKHTVEIETGGEEEFRHEYNITQVKLKTGIIIKEFEEGSETKVVTHYAAPTATLEQPVIGQDGKITATLNVKDSENILKDLKATLYKKQGEQDVWQEELIPVESNAIIEQIGETGKDYVISFNTDCSKVGIYVIKVTGSYERLDGKTHTNEELTNSNIKVEPKITDFTLTADKYVEKSKEITFNISLQDNTGSTITKIELTDNKGRSHELDVNSTIATLTAPEEAGEITYTAKAIHFADGTTISLEENGQHQTTVDVLKDKPKVEYKYDDTDKNNPKITVNVTDKDFALKDNKVTLIVTPLEEGASALLTEVIEAGKETVITKGLNNLEDGKEYKIEIRGTYDLDSKMDDNMNHEENYNFLLEGEKIVGFQIKDFDLKDINVTNVSREENYVEITFKSTNNTYKENSIGIYPVTHIKVEGIEEEIEVTKIGKTENQYDTFRAKIKYDEIDKYRTYKIISAKVLGGKEFTSLDGFGTFEIFKQMPKATITSAKILTEGENTGKIEVKYKIESGLNSITSLKMKVLDKDGDPKFATSENQVVKPNAENEEVTIILDHIPKYAGMHRIQLILEGVNLNNGKTYGEIILAEDLNINIPYTAQIVGTTLTIPETQETSTNKEIVAKKGQNVQIDYEIKINRPVTEYLNNLKLKATGKDGKVYNIGENGKVTLEAPIATDPAKETATYRINVTVPEDAQAFEDINYSVESIGFDTNESNTATLTENNTVKIKVQKQVPEILSVTYDHSTRTISVKVQDEDSAITKGTIVVKENETPVITKVFGSDEAEGKLEAINGVYNIILDNSENVEANDYKVEVAGTYDIGKGPQNLNQVNANIKVYNGDYNFTLTDARVTKVENTEGNKYVYINFKSSNEHNLNLKTVLVSITEPGKLKTIKETEIRCEVIKDGDEYQIKIPFTSEIPTEYIIKEAILENSVKFDTIKVKPLKIFKEEPIATNLSLNLKEKSASFEINDEDSTITYEADKPNAKAVIINTKTGATVAEAKIDNLSNKTVSFENAVPHGTYKLVIEATFDKLNGEGRITKIIGESTETYEQQIEVKVTKIDTNGKKLFAKTDPVDVTMHVTDNTDYIISKFYVHCTPENGDEPIVFEDIPSYEESNHEDGIYTFTTPFTPTTGKDEVLPGVRTCTVEKIEYTDPDNPGTPITVQVEQTPENRAQVEVLKDTPTLSWEKQEMDGKTNLIVKLYNKDMANVVHASTNSDTQFEAGATIELLKLNPATSTYDNVELVDTNKLIGTSEDGKEATRTIELTDNGTYQLKVNGLAYLADKLRDNADLETITRSLTLDTKDVKVVSEYDFKIQNERVVSVDRVAKTATIEFESTNLANDLIKEIIIDDQTFTEGSLSWNSAGERNTEKGKVTAYKYTVTLTNVNPDEKREISFRTVKLSGGKEIKEIPNKLVIYKTLPSATIDAKINLLDNEDANNVDASRKITGTFQITDPEESITKTYINVLKPDGTPLFEQNKEQTVEQNSGVFDLSDQPVNQKGDYIVQILADFDRNCGEPKLGEKIGEAKVTIDVDAHIIENKAQSYYVEKGGDIKITYTIEDNAKGTDRFKPNGFNIVTTVDGNSGMEEFKTVEPAGEEGNKEYYTLTLKAPTKPQTIQVEVKSISYADTENQTSSKAEMNETDQATTKIDVLKNEIKINEYAFDGDKNLRFNLIDTDGAFKEGRVKILKEGEEQPIPGGELSFSKADYETNTNTIKVKNVPTLDEEQKYTIIIEADYDRTTANEDLSENGERATYISTLKNEQQYHLVKDYKFEYKGPITIDSIDEQNGKLTVSFGCSFINDDNLELREAYILENFYEVTKTADERYQVTIDIANTENKLELKLLAVKFSNGRILKKPGYTDSKIGDSGKEEPNLENTDSIFAFLKTPTISEENAEVQGDKKIHVNFKLDDPDNIVTGIKAQVIKGDSSNTTVDYVETLDLNSIKGEEGNISFTINKEYEEAGTYTVKVLFTYDRHDGKIHTDEQLTNSILTAKVTNWAKITSDDRQGENYFVARGEGENTQIPVVYTIDDNDSRDIKAIKLLNEDKEYSVEKIEGSDNKYRVIFDAETKSGEKSFTVEKVVYNQETVALQENFTTTVEILKIAPTVKIGEYNQNDRSIKFTIEDLEDAISIGKAEITSLDGSKVYKTVEINSTNVDQKEFVVQFLQDDKGNDIPKTEPLMLKVIATYSLDQKGSKVVENAELAKQEIAPLNQKYTFKLQGVKILSVDRENATAKLELTVQDNSLQIGGEESQYLMQNFSVENNETPIAVEKISKEGEITKYTASFSYPNDQDGKRQVYKVNKVQIGANSETIEPQEFILFKTKPKTVDLQIDSKSITEESATTSFKIDDPDNAIINAKVGLYEYKYYQDYNQYMDIYMSEKEIQENETNSYQIALDGQKYSTNSKYTVKVEGLYDLADGSDLTQMEEEQTSELIGDEKSATKQFSIPIHSKVEEIKSTGGKVEDDKSIVVDKNKTISLYYRISDNTDLQIKKIVLTDKNNTNPNNQTTWTATRITTGEFKPQEGENGDVYRINYGGKSLAANSGVQDLVIKEIQYDRSRTADIIDQDIQKFKVKKLMPTVTYAGKGTLSTPQADFKIDDPDNAIIDGKVKVEIYGTNDKINDNTDVQKGHNYLEGKDVEINVNEQKTIDFSDYGTLPNGTYDIVLRGKYNLYDNDEVNNEDYVITKNLTVMKDLYFTFENLNIYPQYISESGMLMGMVDIHTEKNLTVKEIRLRFYKDQTNPSDTEGNYVDYNVEGDKLHNWDGDQYTILDPFFTTTSAYDCIKIGQNPLKVLEVVAADESGKDIIFKVNELAYVNITRREGQLAFFTIAEKFNIDKEAMKVSTDLEGYVIVHDWEDYYVPGSLSVCIYDENGELIAEQPIADPPTEEEKQQMKADFEAVDSMPNLSAREEIEKRESIGYRRDIKFENIPIAKSYRAEVHGKWYQAYDDPNLGRMEEVQEGLVKMKHRTGIGAEASPKVDAKLNVSAKTRVGIEEAQTYVKNDAGEWIPSSYVGKGEEVKIEYPIRGNMDAGTHITSATVNKQDVELSAVEGKVDVYETTVRAPEKAGQFDINLTRVGLNTQDYKFTVDNEEYILNSTPVDVLTEEPKVDNFKLDYEKDSIPKATFEINEEKEEGQTTSKTVKKATIDVYEYKSDNNDDYREAKPVQTYQLNSSEGGINLKQDIEMNNLKRGQKYWLQIKADYSLVENEDSEFEGITKFDNSILYSSPLMIQSDDGVKIKVTAPDNVEKNQEIELKFSFDAGTDFLKPVKLKVEGNETLFDVTEEDGMFKANITGYSVSGIKTIKVKQIVLNTGKVIDLPENDNHKVNVEICKDSVGVKNFSFSENGNEITLNLSLKDRESTLIDGNDSIQIEVYESDKNKKVEEVTVDGDKTSLEYKAKFKSVDGVRKYKCIVKAKYSKLESNSEPVTSEIYSTEFSLDDRTIEIKDITNIELMKFENGVTRSVEGLTNEELDNGEQYLIRVSMSNASTFYSDISYYEVKDGKLILTLNYVGAKQYTEGQEGNITVELKDSNTKINYNNKECTYYVSANSFTGLMYLLRYNPETQITLNTDLDASGYVGPTESNVYVATPFKGTINGNGHTIKNLQMSLFKEIQGATIENLNFNNTVVIAKSQNVGLIASNANNSKIKRVNFTGVVFNVSNSCGTMFDQAKGITIEECEITGITLTYTAYNNSHVGGLVNVAEDTTIKNCRVEGTINGWPGYNCLAGVVANARKVTLENCITNVDVSSAYGATYACGTMIGAGNANLVMENCVSIADGGNVSSMMRDGQPINSASSNNFGCSTLKARHSSPAFNYQEKEKFTEEFYRTKLNLDESIWDLTGCGGEILPKLKPANTENKPTNQNVEIPGYERIKEESGYESSKEILYHNLSKLAPYYDSKYIIEDAKTINENEDLNKKIIQGILPIDKNGKIVNSLTSENYQNIDKIKLVFKDRSIIEYKVAFETYFGNVVCYNIPNFYNVKYNFKNYVINKDASIVKELTDYVKNMNYVTSIDTLTKTKDSRLYAESFDDSSVRDDKKYSTIFGEKTVKQEAEQVVIDLLSNNNYNITNDDVKTESVIKNELLTNNKLEKYLLTYTYVKRWYNINVGDYNLKDILLYHADIFEGGLDYDTLTTRLLLNDSNLSTSSTHTFYANNIGNAIGLKQIGDFIDYFIESTGEYKDVNDWLPKNFNGFIVETRLDNQDDRLRYRAWDYLKCWSNTLLPILRVPPKSAYIYSCPTQIHIGATRVYYADPVKNSEAMQKKIENFASSVKKNYETIYGMIGSGSSDTKKQQEALDCFNRKNDIQTDTNIANDGEYVNGKLLSRKAWQYANQTQEDYHKWFAEATGIWTARIGSAAYAYGTRILWEDSALLDNFKIWSHETMHDQDGALILKNHNRRPAVGGESYSDGFLTQGLDRVGYCKFNFVSNYNTNTNATVNWSGDRISSPEKVEDYYDKAFQVNYFLDYMVGQALFELTDEQQEKVLSKMPDTETKPSRAGKGFTRVNSIQDLIDGQYAIDYGAEGFRTIRWYNPLSDVNFTSLDNLWVMSYEMLGYGGYDDGWLLWTTDMLKSESDPLVSDQHALAEITKRKTNTAMDIKEYKMARFKEAQENADKLLYLNKEDIKKQFVETLKQDASEVITDVGTIQMTKTSELKLRLFTQIKRYTDDLRANPFGKQVSNEEIIVNNGKDFIDEVTKNSSAKIKLGDNIDLSAYTTGNSMIRSTFVGEINGNGKKITGVQIPIFESTLNAKFENFTIENPNINMEKATLGALSNTTEKSTISNVKVLGGTIDSKSRETVGALVGQPQETTFDECSVENTIVSGAKNVGGLIGNATNADGTKENINKTTIRNSYSHNTQINGTTKVGGLVGNLEKYAKIEKSSSLEVTINGSQDSIGGLVGEINQGIIENSYSTGAVIGKKNYCGGLVGYAKDPEISYCYTTCTVKGQSYIGGFIGTVKTSGKIKSCISIAVLEKPTDAKFDTGSDKTLIANGFENNYELEEFVGKPASKYGVQNSNIAEIKYISPGDGTRGIDDYQFWESDGEPANKNYGVYFDPTIWNIPSKENLKAGELPTLRGKGNPENTKVLNPQNIQPQADQTDQDLAVILNNNSLIVKQQNKKVETNNQTTATNSSKTKKASSKNTKNTNTTNTVTNNTTKGNTSTATSNNVVNAKTKKENATATGNTSKVEKKK